MSLSLSLSPSITFKIVSGSKTRQHEFSEALKILQTKKPTLLEWVFKYKNVNREKYYFTLLTIAPNASGWFIARSAKTLRFKSIFADFKPPIN